MTDNQILRMLCENGDLSISEIAAKTGASVPTVTKYLKDLEEQDLVCRIDSSCRSLAGDDAEPPRAGKVRAGRQPSLYRVNADSAYFLGVDPKHNVLMLSLMDLAGNVMAEKQESISFVNSPEMMEYVCSRCDNFIASSGIDRSKIRCTAFNISGRVNPKTGSSHSIFNFENDDRPLADILSDRLGGKVIIDNDTRMMAFGEQNCQERRNFKDFLYINVGWGIGLSIIIGGNIYYGADGFCGEFGHTYVYDNEVMCHCGKKGCLETEVSGKAICYQIKQRILAGEMSKLKVKVDKGGDLCERDVIEAAQNDDMLAIEVIEHAGAELGRQVANLINIFNPEAVIIGGALAAAKELLIGPLILSVRRYSLRLMSSNVKIFASALSDNAGSLGACLLARESIL